MHGKQTKAALTSPRFRLVSVAVTESLVKLCFIAFETRPPSLCFVRLCSEIFHLFVIHGADRQWREDVADMSRETIFYSEVNDVVCERSQRKLLAGQYGSA